MKAERWTRISAAGSMIAGAFALALAIPSMACAAGVWSAQQSGTTHTLNAVRFVDANVGWVVGNHGAILKTSDGGAHWTTQSSNTTGTLYALEFVDDSHGWTVGGAMGDGEDGSNQSILLATTDGGLHWVRQAREATVSFRAVRFVDPLHGWAAGEDAILATSDGGRTWTSQYADPNMDIQSLSFVDPLHGWVAGSYTNDSGEGTDGLVLATTDGGVHWTPQTVGMERGAAWMDSVKFVDPLNGWAAGEYFPDGVWEDADWNNAVYHTTDGGSTWTTVSAGLDGLTVGAADATHAWTCYNPWGSRSRIVSTPDGGSSWLSDVDPGVAVRGFWFASLTRGWAVGDSGTILRYKPLSPTKLTLSGSSSGYRGRAYKCSGTISPQTATGKVRIIVKRYTSGAWRKVGVTHYATLSGGRFSYSLTPGTTGNWRIYTTYLGKTTATRVYKPSATIYKAFKVK